MTELSELLDDRCVDLTLKKGRKRVIVSRLAELAARTDAVTDATGFERELLEREDQTSTAIGGGIAIPHKLSPRIARRVLGIARCDAGTNYGAPDGQPVKLFFLLLAPEDALNDHLRVLSRLARFLHDAAFREKLLAATTADEIRSAFQAKERE